jgi:2-desacetyl-2-hydroxyethyl bacteriochlorophyllide A dehydrogenase
VNRTALVFAGPGRVELTEEICPAPAAGQLLVRTVLSGLSAGTELLAYRGQLPADLPLDDTLPSLQGGVFAYPFRYGYAAVGTVVELGAGVDRGWLDRLVFSFQPHASHFVAAADAVFPVPAGIEAESAALYPSQETALNLVLDGEPRLGDRVAVLGQGVVGLCTTALLARFPLETLVAVDPVPARAALARKLGATAAAASAVEARAALVAASQGGPQDGADLTFELTGSPAALDAAIALTGYEGRVVVGSFYGEKRAPVHLGGHFHRGRLTLRSSQVSHLQPGLSARWDRARRMAAAWRALRQLDTRALVSHRFPFARAAEAYKLIDSGAAQALQVVLTHG